MPEKNFPQTILGRSGFVVAGSALIVALFAGTGWWLLRTEYVPLFKQVSEASQAEILATLNQHQLNPRINAQDNAIEVPEEQAVAARAYLAQAGIPSRANVGYELFDQSDYGMSEFTQKINYQRALEGELARSIMGMTEVQYARVHLTLKKAGLFQGMEEPPKASVIVRLRPEGEITYQRVRGIQQLVASAVEGMTQARVVVMDEQGQILSSSDSASATPEHLQMTRQMERTLQDKAEQMLRGSLGNDDFQVAVRVDMNFDKVKSVTETPTGKPVLQHEKKSTSRESSSGDATSKHAQDSQEADYEIGKKHSEVEQASGRIERISVGIVMAGQLRADQQQTLHTLVAAALGLDEARGDQLVIMQGVPGAKRQVAEPLPKLDAPLSSQPDVQQPLPPSLSWLRWALAAAALLISIALLVIWTFTRKRQSSKIPVLPRMSSYEREQLLTDLQRWLQQEGR